MLALLLTATSAARAEDAAASTAGGNATTGALRLGVYSDTDQTSVLRSLASVTSGWGGFSVSATGAVDMITSASVDVRSSPLGAVDMVTSASGRTSTRGGTMSDRRVQGTGGVGWKDGAGHGLDVSASYATERDYDSVSGHLSGSYDLRERTTTLLGGLAFTQNWIGTVLDPGFHRSMYEAGWSVGVAQVLSPSNALRLRYDGSDDQGYQASPYRNVRFGDWSTARGPTGQITFRDTIGQAAGLPENVPGARLRHGLSLDLLQAFDDGIGLHYELRLGRDSWGIHSATAAADFRVAQPGWRLELGYRFYTQSAADFFQDKYVQASTMYTHYSSDKELGEERGQMGNFDVSTVLLAPERPGDTRLLLDGRLAVMRYRYPGFLLLDARTSYFLEAGLTWEL